MIPTYNGYQPYELQIPDMRAIINKQLAGGNQQMLDTLDLTKMQLPDFDPNLATGINAKRKAATAALLGTPDWGTTPFKNYLSPESLALAGKLTDVKNNLVNAQSDLASKGADFSRGLARNQQQFADLLGKANIMNATESSIKGRNADMALTGIRNQAEYTRINKEYQAKLDLLKKQAEEARQRGDTQTWIDILGTIGMIAGIFF